MPVVGCKFVILERESRLHQAVVRRKQDDAGRKCDRHRVGLAPEVAVL